MAVKKHELVHDHHKLDLEALARYIELLNAQPNYMPPTNELIKNFQDIVKCLARSDSREKRVWELLQTVEDFVARMVNSVHSNARSDIVTAILDKFYSYISDPQSDACAAASVILVVLETADHEATLAAARRLVQQGDNGPAGAGLRASLSCMYRWLCEWQGTPLLSNWVLAYINALEENERFDILIEVTVDNLSQLFTALESASDTRQSLANVFVHVFASLRESTEALDRVAPHVGRVLPNLAAESDQWSRQLLQNIVDILSTMMECLSERLKGPAQEAFKSKYSNVRKCLEHHMATRGNRLLTLPAWIPRSVSLLNITPAAPMRKVGLLNLGNTCYMNSVMQALLVTRQFSTHVVMNMTAAPYWAKMGVLFARMMHSVTTKLNPDDFFKVVKPPFFTKDNQHDSSEFLGYLFELLQSYEHGSDRNFDYSRPPILTGSSRMRAIAHAANQASHSSSDNDHSAHNSRSASPRPGGSSSGSSGNKRMSAEREVMVPPKKRLRMSEAAFLRRDSFIDSMFGGVLLTRVECTECHSSSLSRDVFRDLQLAFPEKPEGWQHNVQTLLEYYCSKERLTGENQYECRDCGGLRDAERSVLIETTPKYLILVLKNFKFEPKLQVQTKLMHTMFHNHEVSLPTVRAQADHAAYTLYAAVIHAGTTLDSGHYYTLAKDSDLWHTYNDDNVTTAVEGELNTLNRSSTPYILFYRRTDIEEGTAPSMEELPPKLQESVLAHNKHYVETVRKMRMTHP